MTKIHKNVTNDTNFLLSNSIPTLKSNSQLCRIAERTQKSNKKLIHFVTMCEC